MSARSTAPVDAQHEQLIQALSPRPDVNHHSIAIGATSERNATAFSVNTLVIEITADVPCYFKLGDSGVTADANSARYPGDKQPRIYSIGGFKQDRYTHIAVLQRSGAGTLDVNEMF